jgi:OmcA/MtrC family decaheme c-type cytochrome
VSCHGPDGAHGVAVHDIEDEGDAHYVDTDSDGPMTPSGYRQINVTIDSVDLRNNNVEITFTARDEEGDPVTNLFASDGRFTIAELIPATTPGFSDDWQSLITRIRNPAPGVGDGPGLPAEQANYERFDSIGGVFEDALGLGEYRYTSAYDPSTYPVQNGQTIRVAIQISSGDIPPENTWCDFDVSLAAAITDCDSASVTRDIVQTDTCNGCHGPTTNTQLGIHGGGRTDVEYCVTCHNPGTTDPESGNNLDLKIMAHKIHYGSHLANGYRIWGYRNSLHDYSNVNFPKEVDDCQACHKGGGSEVENWSDIPTRAACGSCHDEIDWTTGDGHPAGPAFTDEFCVQCHPKDGVGGFGGAPAPVETVHRGQARNAEAGRYADIGDGYIIDDLVFDPGSDELTIDFSVQRDGGAKMNLQTDPEWTDTFPKGGGGSSRLAISVGWDPDEYTNEGANTPALPLSIDALDGPVTPMGGNVFRVVADVSDAGDTITVAMDGHAAADLVQNPAVPSYDFNIAVRNETVDYSIAGGRHVASSRRAVVDVTKCNGCHDSGGVGVSLHGNNRTGNIQACNLCHTPDTTDINRRPADPGDTADGKVEESVDFKRMIHQIHSGQELENGIVIWGFGFPGTEHDFSDVAYTGDRGNCETCHFEGTYGAEQAWDTLASTIDTGAEIDDPSDDLNISPVAAACSSCHDDAIAKDHMILHGASFHALDEDIH